MKLDNAFEMGQTVYLKTDTDQKPRLVTGFRIRPENHIAYFLSCGAGESIHYAVEISTEVNILLTSTH